MNRRIVNRHKHEVSRVSLKQIARGGACRQRKQLIEVTPADKYRIAAPLVMDRGNQPVIMTLPRFNKAGDGTRSYHGLVTKNDERGITVRRQRPHAGLHGTQHALPEVGIVDAGNIRVVRNGRRARSFVAGDHQDVA